jgi:hypothetical protein
MLFNLPAANFESLCQFKSHCVLRLRYPLAAYIATVRQRAELFVVGVLCLQNSMRSILRLETLSMTVRAG